MKGTESPSAQSSTTAAKGSGSKQVRGRPFQKGQSGNPGGRAKGLSAAVREKAPAEDLAAWQYAIWQRDEKMLKELGIPLEQVTMTERQKAHEWLSDHGYGKAPSHAPVEGGDPLELGDVDRAIGAVVDELAGRREASAPRSPESGTLAAAG